MHFTEQEITLALTPFAQKVGRASTITAHVCGALAYHRSLTFPDYWGISHVPTGYGIGDHIATEADAQAIIALALESGIEWDTSDPQAINQQNQGTPMRSFVAAVKQLL